MVSAAAVVIAALAAGVLGWLGTALVGTPIAFADGLLGAINVLPVALLALGIGVAPRWDRGRVPGQGRGLARAHLGGAPPVVQ